MSTLAPGLHIADRYRLDRRIAVGGMGEVWEASDTRLDRAVAVKVLRPELSGDEEFLHRFRIEARTVASLDHSGIALVHDYGEDDATMGERRTAYLVMELVRGEPLSNRISRGRMDADETLEILEHAAWALDAAHQRGFVHRDVKPGNILLREDGVVKLTDFGIAKAANAVPVTRSGMVMGTAHYIAPEQASGGEAGPAGDVYSLGIVGYECLAGKRPFRAENPVVVAMMQVRDAPPPLPEDVPENVRQLVDAVLVKDPMHRYRDGAELARAIAAVRRGEPMPRPSRMPDDVELPGAAAVPVAGPAPEAAERRRSRLARSREVISAGRRGADDDAPVAGRRSRSRGRAAHRAEDAPVAEAWSAPDDAPDSPVVAAPPAAPPAAVPAGPPTGTHALVPPGTPPPDTWQEPSRPTPRRRVPEGGRHAATPPAPAAPAFPGSVPPGVLGAVPSPVSPAPPVTPHGPGSVPAMPPASSPSMPPVSSPSMPPVSSPSMPPVSAVETTVETTATSARLAATGPVATPDRPAGAHRLADDHEPLDDLRADPPADDLDPADTPSRVPGSEPVSLEPRSRSRNTALVVLFVVLAVVAVLVTLLLLLPRLVGSSSAMSEPSGFAPGSVSRQEGVAMGWTAHRVGGTGNDVTENVR
ncbi:MAG: serine/threonine protein kinase [Pseudonocardia sp.]|nr:serine/threonine protein kinase [Pseudonocardia sp.]ODU13191.1 MAG: hypothetical protein ABS80_21665 [Pseudonocardia sp. SCN 72-51]